MRNKIRLLQGEAPAGLSEALGGPLPEGAPLDSPASSQTGQEDEEGQALSSPQRRRFRSCAGLASLSCCCLLRVYMIGSHLGNHSLLYIPDPCRRHMTILHYGGVLQHYLVGICK